jgi:hypothetical protein
MPDAITHWDSTPETPGGFAYQRHKPEETVLYKIVEQYLPAFQSHLSSADISLPGFVHDEFRQYLRCGSPPGGSCFMPCHRRTVARGILKHKLAKTVLSPSYVLALDLVNSSEAQGLLG